MGEIRDFSNISDDDFARLFQDVMGARGRPIPREERLEEGQAVAGTIVGVARDDVFVDLGGKAQGVIPRGELAPDATPAIGERIEAFVIRFEPDEGLYVLSRQRAARGIAWEDLREGMLVEARVTGTNKGGLELELAGMRAFMPASQVERERVEDLEAFVGRKLVCEVTQLDREARNVILSRRVVLEREAAERRRELLASLLEGEVRQGTVRKAMPFGIFVDLGGIDGLVHVSEIRREGASETSEEFEPGRPIEVRILAIDRASERISLGLVRRKPDLWLETAAQYAPGEETKGWVARIEDEGVWVALGEGVEAFLPRGEMGRRAPRDPREVVREGQVVDVIVRAVDREARRILLTMRRPEEDPWIGLAERLPPGSTVEVRVTRLTRYGAFAEVERGVRGLIHISELADGPIERASDVVRPGDRVRARVLRVDPENRRIALSLRRARDDMHPEA